MLTSHLPHSFNSIWLCFFLEMLFFGFYGMTFRSCFLWEFFLCPHGRFFTLPSPSQLSDSTSGCWPWPSLFSILSLDRSSWFLGFHITCFFPKGPGTGAWQVGFWPGLPKYVITWILFPGTLWKLLALRMTSQKKEEINREKMKASVIIISRTEDKGSWIYCINKQWMK